MTDHTDLVKSFLKHPDAGSGIISEILDSAVIYIAFISSESTVIIAQSRDACTGKGIGYHCKRLVLEYFLITVLLTAAGHHHQCRGFPGISFRKGQGAIQGDISIIKDKFFSLIWIWRLRGLRTVQLRFSRSQSQRK